MSPSRRGGVLLKRVLFVVMVSMSLTVGFTVLLFNVLSHIVFTSYKSAELMPKARALGSLVSECMSDGDDAHLYREFISQIDPSLMGAYFAVFNMDSELLFVSSDLNPEEVRGFSNMLSQVMNGQEVTVSGQVMTNNISVVGVGTPIWKDGVQIGCVMTFLPMFEVMAALSSLNIALIIALICVIPIVGILVLALIERLVRPLRQMRDVSMSMASGNYNVRADDSQKGEIGQLAQSLNHLARELSRTIGDLTLERNRLRQSLDGLSEGFISVNSLGRVTHHNPAVSSMFNVPFTADETNREQLIPNANVWADFDDAVSANRIVLRDIDVNGRLIHSTISPLAGENGEVAGAVGLFTDITESERLERTRRDYVANVSHELRTPLTAMRAILEPLRDGMVRTEEARQRYYDIMLRETLRLSRLINDLMELSRLQSGSLAIDKEVLPMAELIGDLAEKYRAAAEEKNQTFHLMFNPADCPPVYSNPDRIEQVLVILLDNAMKYTPEGGEIFLNGRWNDSHVVLSVRDTGIGISEGDLPYVFDRFYKADKSHTGSSGSGLGLSIAREMLKWMGEDIFVASEDGRGSEFSFTIQRA